MTTKSLKCDECPKAFSVAELDAEDPNAWGHPCGNESRFDMTCESHRTPQIEYLPAIACPICGLPVCVRVDGTFVPHLTAGQAPPCAGSNALAPIPDAAPAALDGQGSLF